MFFWDIRKSIHTSYLPCRVMSWRKLHCLPLVPVTCPHPWAAPSSGILSYTPAVPTKGKKFGDPGWGDRLVGGVQLLGEMASRHRPSLVLGSSGPSWAAHQLTPAA